MDLSTWKTEYDPMLENMEKDMKNPKLGPKARRKIIDFVYKWVSSSNTRYPINFEFLKSKNIYTMFSFF